MQFAAATGLRERGVDAPVSELRRMLDRIAGGRDGVERASLAGGQDIDEGLDKVLLVRGRRHGRAGKSWHRDHQQAHGRDEAYD